MDIGPCLPPHLLKKKKDESADAKYIEVKVQIGPSLPPNLTGNSKDKEDDDDDAYGPALPPHLAKPGKSNRNIGPTFPGKNESLETGKYTYSHVENLLKF